MQDLHAVWRHDGLWSQVSVCAVVGGQYGSEGKGLIVGHIAKDYDHHVRVGAANAGHTVYTAGHMKYISDSDLDAGRPVEYEYEKHVMQQIPCAAYANPKASLYIGPGAQISPEIFMEEITALDAWRAGHGLSSPQVIVDPRAHVVTDEHIQREQESDLARRIGSTSTIAKEGIGAAQAARVMRDESCYNVREWYLDRVVQPEIFLADVPMLLDAADSILLEGTQGTGLSLTTGQFPYVTSRNTTAAGLCADMGVAPSRLAPSQQGRVILVCRSYPIRVAGNSGPFWGDSLELDWPSIGVDPENERTTVTKKVRRVAEFSLEQVAYAATLNGATEIALTFADYIEPELYGVSGEDVDLGNVDLYIERIEARTGLPVSYIGTGPHSVIERHPAKRELHT
jgi:adenylosuccinate synthase